MQANLNLYKDPDDRTGFADVIGQYDWDETTAQIMATTPQQVESVLAVAASNQRQLTPEEFMVLISPAASPYIEDMAVLSRRFTRRKIWQNYFYVHTNVCLKCVLKCMCVLWI